MNHLIEELPYSIRQLTYAIKNQTQADISLCFTALLSSISSALQGKINVKLPWGTTTSVNLFSLVIAPSGARKTTVANKVFEPHYIWQKTIDQKNQKIQEQYELDCLTWKNKLARLKRQLSKLDDLNQEDQEKIAQLDYLLAEHQHKKPQLTRFANPIMSNATIQAVVNNLAHLKPNILWVNDESADLINKTHHDHQSNLNSLWSHGSFQKDRVSGESFTTSNANLSICWMLQPDILNQIFSKKIEQWQSSGLLARFLICSASDLSLKSQIDHSNNQEYDSYKNKITTWLNESFDANAKMTLALDAEALNWYNNLQPGDPCKLSSQYNDIEFIHKFDEHCIRIAAILHFYEFDNIAITKQTLETAFHITHYYLEQQQNLLDGHGELELQHDAEIYLEHIKNHAKHESNLKLPSELFRFQNYRSVLKSVIMRSGKPRKYREKKHLDVLLEYMQSKKMIQLYTETKFHTKPTERIFLLPEFDAQSKFLRNYHFR